MTATNIHPPAEQSIFVTELMQRPPHFSPAAALPPAGHAMLQADDGSTAPRLAEKSCPKPHQHCVPACVPAYTTPSYSGDAERYAQQIAAQYSLLIFELSQGGSAGGAFNPFGRSQVSPQSACSPEPAVPTQYGRTRGVPASPPLVQSLTQPAGAALQPPGSVSSQPSQQRPKHAQHATSSGKGSGRAIARQ
jgi:hypothetical protein